MTQINKVAVIGSGVMGSGIAAQCANAGLEVVLLDIKIEGKDLAKDAVTRMLKTEPAPFMSAKNAALITTGNLEDDIGLLGECDWIIEVVLEDLKIKHATYEKIEANRKKGSIVSSNTSTIPLHKLVEGQPDSFAKDFMITHFFNPPRYMRLLELVVGEKTDKKAAETIAAICDEKLGKGVVKCNDTPGFIANRLGVYWLTRGVNEAIKQGVSIELADAVLSKPVGIPKTGVFGLIDLVGIDLMPKLSASLLSTLPQKDDYRDEFIDHKFVHGMIEASYTGRKGKGGFFRLNPENPKAKEKQALHINADKFDESQYAKADKPSDPAIDAGRAGLKAVVTTDSPAGKYAWEVLKGTLSYAAQLVGEIADTVHDIDEGMKLGYNWKQGPFEMIDALGAKWFAEKLAEDGLPVPEILQKLLECHSDRPQGVEESDIASDPSTDARDDKIKFYRIENGRTQFFGTDGKYHDIVRPEGVLLLRDLKLTANPVISNKSASLWDIGDGILCFEHTSKMNTFDEEIFAALMQTKSLIESSDDYKALVVYNEGSHFSAGANLGLAVFMINLAMWAQVEEFIRTGQRVFMDLKFANFPVVSAPSGMALGGGCEILLASDAVQAHAETYTGLVEVGVGLLPGWGGCKEMILRYQEKEREKFSSDMSKIGKDNIWFSPDTTPVGAPRSAFETIAMAKVAKSAQDAKEIGYFRPSDGITMNRDRLLYDAKQRALKLAENYTPPAPREDIRLGGAGAKLALDMAVSDLQKSGKATPYDGVVSGHVASVLSGGDNDYMDKLSEKDMLELELTEFMKLLHNEGTLERIEHMLGTGKPLRN